MERRPSSPLLGDRLTLLKYLKALFRVSWPSPGGQPLAGSGGRAFRPRLEMLEERAMLSVNPIVAENLLPGTPQSVWDVPGAGDPTIQGFATDISVNQGQTINFKINDTAKAPYHIDIYRLGYYQGLGARLVSTIGAAQTLDVAQPSPKFDPATALVDAGNWSVTASWAVPTNATSGVYFARVARNDTGGAFMILFVVRNDSSSSQVIFQTSDATWEAYNTWGGYSLYQYTGSTPGPGYQGAANAVSYNRPLIDRGTPGGLGDTNSFFYDEFPMVQWLEQNGYDTSYFTDMDSDRNGSLIQNHQIFLSVGHDEYWSGNQMANVTAARNAGVNLAFFSGNEAFWKTYYSASIDGSNTAYRTLDCYKETHQNAITDPNNPAVWTGTWMDPRFSPPTDGGQPQNQLTGTLFMVNRGANDTGTPLTVPYADSQLSIWRNTSVAQLQPGQTATLGDSELGYEWDEDVDNGFRPAGLIDLSSTTQSVTQLMYDYGNTFGPGTATNSMTEYRASSGALVFSAGMVQFDWGLSGLHDGPGGTLGLNSTPVTALQQMTVNLFANMDVQPGSLQAGLVPGAASTAVTAPTSVITSPAGGASILTGTPVTITGTATAGGGGVVAGVEVSVDGGQTWHPATGIIDGKTTNWSYSWVPTIAGTIKIESRATDDSGNIETPSGGVTVSVSYKPTSTTGLVGAYSFSQGSGSTLVDSSGNNNNGTISNATWAPGLFGGHALSFNGTNSWVTINNSSSLTLTGGMTLEAWVNPAATTSGSAAILVKQRTAGLDYALYSDDSGGSPPSTYVDISGTDSKSVGQSLLPLNTWSHLAATYDGSNLMLYVNGTLVSTQFVGGNINTASGVLRLGGDSIWGEYFDGLIDQVRIYNRPLNVGEIRSDMSTPIGGSIETSAPTVSVTGPASGATVSGTTTLSVNASDDVYVGSVQFLLNGQPVGTAVATAPYSLSWNTLTVPNGTYTLSARATDLAGNSATSAGETITVNNPPNTSHPVVRISYPPNGFTTNGQVVLNAVASDPVGIQSVQYQLNGANIGPALTTAPYRLLWDSTAVAQGTYTVTAVATDVSGNTTTSSPVSITVDRTRPSVVSVTPPTGTAGVSTASSLTATFSKSVQSGTIGCTLTDPSGNQIPTTVSYNDSTLTATITHGTVALDPLTTYTATISGVTDLAGNVMTTPFSWTFTTGNAIVGATIWAPSVTPTTPLINDPSSVELGVAFQSTLAGTISGIRFYKGGPGNGGTHVGHLWTSTGQLLATATFTNETSFGWQQVNFATPVNILANTTYIASYYAPQGNYAGDAGYFASQGVTSGPLEAMQNSAGTPDGVYHYAAGGGFPASSFNSTNYWVDVVFNSTTASTTPPTVTAETPLPNTTGIAQNTTVTATFSKAVQAGTISFTLADSTGHAVAGSVSYNSSTNVATFTPTAALSASTSYTATVSATDLTGNVMTAPFTWSFTTTNPALPPTVTAETPAPGSTGVAKGTPITATFSQAVQDTTISFVLTDSSGNLIPGTLSYDDEANVATFTPGSALAPNTTYKATVSGAQNLSNIAMTAPVSWSFTTAIALTGDTLWSPTVTPAVASASDTNAVEVGVKFESAVAGTITGLRFYKGTANTGTHVGDLWTSSGQLLATATFSGETASGWQQVNFATPVNISANTFYIASYFAPRGGYAYTGAYFATSGVVNGPLQAPANGVDGGQGVYVYGGSGGFPTQSFNGTNYWVDIVFSPSTGPAVTGETPAPGATGVSTGTLVTASFNDAVQPGTISFVLQDSAGNTVLGTVSYNSTTNTATFAPNAPLAGLTTYTATVSRAVDSGGAVMSAPSAWSFTTAGNTLWASTATPAVASAGDPNAIELGVKFESAVAGTITGLRFYKGAANTGTHVGHLWTASGTLLASATFSGETASGWQQVNFATPVTVTANTIYVASYYAPNGDYAYTGGYFTTSGVTNGSLTAPANGADGGQGVYQYGTGGAFPAQSFNGTNYWVDVVFVAGSTDIAPTVVGETPAPAATAVLTGTAVTATFNEGVQASTISFTLQDGGGKTVAGAVSYNSTTLTATFTPGAPLAPSTTYTATVSASDVAGTPMASPFTWSFTTQNAWQQTTAADFGAGTLNGTAVTNTAGGEVQLGTGFSDNFAADTSLSSSWTSNPWQVGGGVNFSGSVVSVAGTEVLSAQTYSSTGVEASLNFMAAPYQHFGLATDLGAVAGNTWAIFSTMGTANTLFARVNVNGVTTDVSLGALPTGFHTYAVQPLLGAFQFSIDGVVQATINAAVSVGTPLHIAMSSYSMTSPGLQAAWVRTLGGTFTSSVFNAGKTATWGAANWTASVPAGTTMIVLTRSGNTPTPDGTWSNWTPVSNGGTVTSPSAQYLQYLVIFVTTDPNSPTAVNDPLPTPILDNISFNWS
jgi:hypothetical protein